MKNPNALRILVQRLITTRLLDFLVASTTLAIVPADLRSAGKKYKDLQSDNFLFCIISQFYANLVFGFFTFRC